eukprot:UN01854
MIPFMMKQLGSLTIKMLVELGLPDVTDDFVKFVNNNVVVPGKYAVIMVLIINIVWKLRMYFKRTHGDKRRA